MCVRFLTLRRFKKGVAATIPTARWPAKANDNEPFIV
jgi:hypothetical protein